MTCRQILVLGLFVALTLSSAVARCTHAASQWGAAGTTANSDIPEISLRRSGTPATGAATWQASSFDGGTDIRFKKPGVIAASPTAQPAGKTVNPISTALQTSPTFAPSSNEPVIISDAANESPDAKPNQTAAPPARRNANAGTTASQAAAASPQNADIRPLPKPAEAAYPQVTQAIAAEQVDRPGQPAAMSLASKLNLEAAAKLATQPSTEAAARPEVRLTDEQLQQVSRILMDNQVIRAAEEESLPPSPGANGHDNGTKGGKHHAPNLDDEPLYYGGDCCPPQPRLFWTAGVEATFLNPDLNTDGVSATVEEIDDDRYDICTTLSNDVDSFYVSPRIWLGVQGCCWGANLRYWHLQAAEGAFDPSIGGLGTWDDFDCGRPDFGFMTCSRLEAYTVDLELTRRFCLNDCAMQAAVGLRHADLENDDALWALANTDEGLLTGMARASRVSRGTGVMLGLYGRKPVFPCSCVHWFYNARWSALWGKTQTSVESFASVQTIVDPDISGSAASVNGAYTNIHDTLFIGEIQLGLEWDYCLQCVPANAFFRAALEYQRWDGGRGFSQSQSFAGATIEMDVDPTSIITMDAAAAGPQMDLFGIALSTGLTW